MHLDEHSTTADSLIARKPRWSVWLLAALAAAATLYFVSTTDPKGKPVAEPKHERPRDAAIPVAITKAAQGDFPVYLNGLGSATALQTVTVRSRVDGELMHVHFKEGQMVHAGELLAEIDPRPFQVQLRQAQGAVARDTAMLKNAQMDLVRYQKLQTTQAIAAQQVATQESLVKQYRSNLELDQVQVDNAKLQLNYARITAPISGRVGLRLVDRGNMVQASAATGIVVITQVQPIAVVFSLPEDRLPSLMEHWKKGSHIPVDAYDRVGTAKLASGELTAVDNQIDATTGTIKLKAQFPNEDYTLFANQFVNIKMKLDTLKAAIIIPTTAIQRGSQGAFVYLVKEDKTVTVRPIRQGPVEGEFAVIAEGLSRDDALVVDGADKLREGNKVEVIQRDAANSALPVGAPHPPESRQTPAASGS